MPLYFGHDLDTVRAPRSSGRKPDGRLVRDAVAGTGFPAFVAMIRENRRRTALVADREGAYPSSHRRAGAYLVSSQIQFTSHVLPPRSENDCSIRADVGDRSSQTYRTRMVLPFHSCYLKNSPRRPVNRPATREVDRPLVDVEEVDPPLARVGVVHAQHLPRM